MMQKHLLLFITIFLLNHLHAQRTVDSLRLLLASAKEDTIRIKLMNTIGADYSESKPDSTLKYGGEALKLSRKANYKKGQVYAILNLSAAFAAGGDLPTGLEYGLNALKMSESLGDKELVADCFGVIGFIYMASGDDQQALHYTLKAKEIYEEIHSDLGLTGILLNAGALFIDLGQLDSSRVYLNRSLELSLKLQDYRNAADVYLNLGRVHVKMTQYDIASAYYRQAIPTFIADSNYLFLYSTYYFLGALFDSTEHTDSALFYSKLALITANKMNSPISLVEINKQLASLIKRMGKLDSAFVYEEMAMQARDSLSGQEKERKLRLLTFNEEIRQMNIAEQKRKDALARKRNLELAGIAIFIPSFFFIVLLFGRRKVKSRTVEFLGVLSLLFLFEFIVLFIHPYIGSWTNESQVLMLLILVAIAVILVPLHHRLEKWMKRKLTTGRKVEIYPQAETVSQS